MGNCANQDLAHFTMPARKNGAPSRERIRAGTSRCPARRADNWIRKENEMFGKLASAWLGSRIAGRNSGASGAALGLGAAALARRGFGPLAMGALAVWGGRKLLARRHSRSAAYPSEATPSSF
jgi:hypothetical protein